MLILLILNFLVRSGRMEKIIVFVKQVYKRRSVRIARAALLLLLVFLLTTSSSYSTSLHEIYHHLGKALPIPKGVNNMLFYLQRDPDENTVVYQLNFKDGEVDSNVPVNAFWIKYADGGQIKELTAIQRKLAYGLLSKPLGNGNHELRFVSYPKLPLYLIKENGSYIVTAWFDQKQLILKRIFVRVKEGRFYFPKVEYIELIGNDAVSGTASSYRINI